RPVGVAHVDPAAHAVGHLLPQVDVPLHGLAAPRVELRDAVRLDVGLALEAQLLLDRELHREAVTVPAALAADLVALHGPEPREDVLERAGLDVVGAGAPVGGRRTLVEGPRLAGLLQALLEDPVLAPELEDAVLEGRQVDLRGDWAVLAHRASFVSGGRALSRPLTKGRRPGRLGPVSAVPPSLAGPIGADPLPCCGRVY